LCLRGAKESGRSKGIRPGSSRGFSVIIPIPSIVLSVSSQLAFEVHVAVDPECDAIVWVSLWFAVNAISSGLN